MPRQQPCADADARQRLLTFLVWSLPLLAGMLLRRSEPLGYLIAIVLLVLLLILAPAIIAQTISQLVVEIEFTPGEVIGPIAGFVVLGAIAARCLIGLLRPLAAGAGRSA